MAGTKDWSRSTERPWKNRAFTVFGVREGAKYQIRVIACNAAGEGTPGFTESVFVRNPAGEPGLHTDFTKFFLFLCYKADFFILYWFSFLLQKSRL